MEKGDLKGDDEKKGKKKRDSIFSINIYKYKILNKIFRYMQLF